MMIPNISKKINVISKIFLVVICCISHLSSPAQSPKNIPNAKKISPHLFGLFFEDINYAADGGLYAELVQNRSFEYSPTDKKEWHSLSFWEYITPGFSYGSLNTATSDPVHENNPHYAVLTIEHVGSPAELKVNPSQTLPASIVTGQPGVGIKNSGFGTILVKAGEKYNFSLFVKQLSDKPVELTVSLQNPKGKVLAESRLSVDKKNWNKYTASLTATESNDSTFLVVLGTTEGKIALDLVSLFPEKTFKNRPNGLRADLAQLLADMKPAFIRFPGGCLAHGDGIGNMYRWKNTIGPLEQRVEQKNLWGYHQTGGLGYYEYFQFCEDIGAKPLPVLPAAVSCQNSGGTWRIGGTGQKALPLEEMQAYIQEVLDLIEWANGPATSKWGALRASAGHPQPFNLQFIGIGNEDKITPEFEARFSMICKAIKTKHPEIKIIGTSGPFSEGEDFDKGWKIATNLQVAMVDEHYYKQPEWFLANQKRYDRYDRNKPQVYLGEYASWGNKLHNAIAEAAYMVGLERNGDVVQMASYAPLFAKKDNTQWKTDMIFFDNAKVFLTPNYYVQKLFSANAGDYYFDKIITSIETDTTLAASCVMNSKTGDVILKIVNTGEKAGNFKINLTSFKNLLTEAQKTVLTGLATAENSFENPNQVVPQQSAIKIGKSWDYTAPPMSLTVIRLKAKH